MADVKDHVTGRGGQAGANRYFHDNGDGTFSEGVGAHMYVKVGGVWVEWNGAVTGGGGGSGASIPNLANNSRGSATITVSSTTTLVSVIGPVNFRGYQVNGNGDAYVSVLSDSTEKYADHISMFRPCAQLVLPSAEIIGGTITIKVTNNGTGSADFQAVLFCE